MAKKSHKSAWIDFLICFFLGFYGVHKFREKKIGLGLLYLFTGGLFAFGWLFDCAKYLIVAINTLPIDFKINDIMKSNGMHKAKTFFIANWKKIAFIVGAFFLLSFLLIITCSPNTNNDHSNNSFNKSSTTLNSTENTSSNSDIDATTQTGETEALIPPTTESTAESTTAPTTEPTSEATSEPLHTHNFSTATCVAPKTCSCGATEGGANGHNWKNATCQAPKTCTACGITEGTTIDHSWTTATCTAPQKCRTCSAEKGSATGHNYNQGTCLICGSKDPNHVEITYVLNTHTKKFHKTTCHKVPTDNRIDSTLSRDEIIDAGYEPCKLCHP